MCHWLSTPSCVDDCAVAGQPIPELPELEVVQEVLNRRIPGQTITAAEAIPPGAAIVVRDLTGAGFGAALVGARFEYIARRGKFLVFTLEQDGGPLWLVINPKLTRRLQLCEPKAKKAGPIPVLHLSGGWDLRYVGQKKMGQVFVTRQPPDQAPAPALPAQRTAGLGAAGLPLGRRPRGASVADYARMGPETLEICRDDFKSQLRPYRGEIKDILTRGDFVAGIGNAYADEILWMAKLHPYARRRH